MRNWPKSEEASDKIVRFIAPIYGKYASKIPFLKKTGFVVICRHFLLSKRHLMSFMRTKKPDGIDLQLYEVTFVDLFFAEDFEKLKQGLRMMQQCYERGMYSLTDELEHWFSNIELNAGSWRRYGTWPSVYKQDDRLSYADSITIELYALSPSMVCVAMRVKPSEKMKQEFNDLLDSNAEGGRKIRRSNVHRHRWFLTQDTPVNTRQKEVAQLFLKLNKQIVSLTRDFINRGWARVGPLPSIETFLLKQGEMSEDDHDFWDSLGLSHHNLWRYQKGGFVLYPQDEETVRYSKWKALIIPDAIESEITSAYANVEDALDTIGLDHTLYLPCLVALKAQWQELLKRVSNLRSELAPALVNPTSVMHRLAWRRMFKRALRVNQFSFEYSRLSSEVSDKTTFLFRCPELDGFERKKFSKRDKNQLLEDQKFLLKKYSGQVGLQLRILEKSFSKRFSYALQTTNFWLACVGTVLTLVGISLALPNSWKAALWGVLKKVIGVD